MDGWFATRDRGRLDADGYLFIEGRADDTIIRGGENIAPAEIEDVLVEHPSVRDCVVVGPEDPEWGQIIVAVVVPADGATRKGMRPAARSLATASRTVGARSRKPPSVGSARTFSRATPAIQAARATAE